MVAFKVKKIGYRIPFRGINFPERNRIYIYKYTHAYTQIYMHIYMYVCVFIQNNKMKIHIE